MSQKRRIYEKIWDLVKNRVKNENFRLRDFFKVMVSHKKFIISFKFCFALMTSLRSMSLEFFKKKGRPKNEQSIKKIGT